MCSEEVGIGGKKFVMNINSHFTHLQLGPVKMNLPLLKAIIQGVKNNLKRGQKRSNESSRLRLTSIPRKSLLHKRVVFMLIVMESHHLPIVGINPGKSNDRAAKITADIFNNGFWVAKIGLGINVESISVPMVNGGFHLFKRGTDAFFQFI